MDKGDVLGSPSIANRGSNVLELDNKIIGTRLGEGLNHGLPVSAGIDYRVLAGS
jgi:hypothetical protein